MSQDLKAYLHQALARLTRVVTTAQQGGTKETEKAMIRMRLLEELIKEQMPYEDARTSTRAPR